MDNFQTLVLATVFVKAWKLWWGVSVTGLILGSHSSCRQLMLHAVSGGEFINAPQGTPARKRTIKTNCDGELCWVALLCEALGGKIVGINEGKNYGKYTLWLWEFERAGGAEPSASTCSSTTRPTTSISRCWEPASIRSSTARRCLIISVWR